MRKGSSTLSPDFEPNRHDHHDHEHDPDLETSPLHRKATHVSSFSLVDSFWSPGERRFGSVAHVLLDFCTRTSSHGIPHIGSSYTLVGRLFWTVVFIGCALAFAVQTYWTIFEYVQYRVIIEMQLRFEAAPFPAVTVCNLNPYKNSFVQNVEQIQQSLSVFRQAIDKGGGDQADAASRQKRFVLYEPILVRCRCLYQNQECTPLRNPLEKNASVCICFHDALSGNIWPCYPTSVWTEEYCAACSISNSCPYPIDKNNASQELTTPCLCQSVSNFCMVRPVGQIQWWTPFGNKEKVVTGAPPTTTTTAPQDVRDALGLEDRRDKGAITARTKENLVFIVASLDRNTRIKLSYNLYDFVIRCSFNSEDCSMSKDFRLHLDPVFGNCFTFNYNDSVKLTNSRAGPMYGLRLLLNVNQSDYLPTTEAAGVRLVVHEQDEEPFPDTFGYSAPVGFVSSFGLKTKQVFRKGPPYGKCVKNYRPEGYIYEEEYSTEGCYRSCFQRLVIAECGCGDPRFPFPPNERVCHAVDPVERKCLENITNVLGGFHHMQQDCNCIQPCSENVFETAYSAAAWPAANFKTGDCQEMNLGNDSVACTEYFKQNTAYIEIYYEQLNFELLKETEAYTIVNLLSDFGGNIGLWIGFSVITMVEFCELFVELFYFCYFQKIHSKRRKKRRHYDMQYANRIALQPTPYHSRTMEDQIGLDNPVETELIDPLE